MAARRQSERLLEVNPAWLQIDRVPLASRQAQLVLVSQCRAALPSWSGLSRSKQQSQGHEGLNPTSRLDAHITAWCSKPTEYIAILELRSPGAALLGQETHKGDCQPPTGEPISAFAGTLKPTRWGAHLKLLDCGVAHSPQPPLLRLRRCALRGRHCLRLALGVPQHLQERT